MLLDGSPESLHALTPDGENLLMLARRAGTRPDPHVAKELEKCFDAAGIDHCSSPSLSDDDGISGDDDEDFGGDDYDDTNVAPAQEQSPDTTVETPISNWKCTFCFERWSGHSNKCPICKGEFGRIERVVHQETRSGKHNVLYLQNSSGAS